MVHQEVKLVEPYVCVYVCVCVYSVHVCLSGVWAAVCVHPEVEVVELVELTNEQTPSFDEG